MNIPSWLGRLLARIEVTFSGYYEEMGWFQTRAERLARDASGQPIPWFTYPAIAFLAGRVRAEFRVLEFGAGMGTLWWSKQVRSVTAVEHDLQWAQRMENTGRATILRTEGGSAEAYIRPALDSGHYDVVIVDGIHRNECLVAAQQMLTPGGVVILDDAQREEYQSAIQTLVQAGFRAIEFHGPTPVGKHKSCTAVYYRDGNVLDI